MPFLPVAAGRCASGRRHAPPRAAGERPTSIGRLRSFVGSSGVLVRAYAYIRAHGGGGLRRGQRTTRSSPRTTCKARARRGLRHPVRPACKHEFVAPPRVKQRTGVRTLDVAKRLIDYGFHPPTIYFPLTVEEAMLIEPTETESLETLDALRRRAASRSPREAETDPELVTSRAARRAGPPPRRGHRGPPAEPPLAGHDRRPDAVSGLTPDHPRTGD